MFETIIGIWIEIGPSRVSQLFHVRTQFTIYFISGFRHPLWFGTRVTLIIKLNNNNIEVPWLNALSELQGGSLFGFCSKEQLEVMIYFGTSLPANN